jgi:hypothetical protein
MRPRFLEEFRPTAAQKGMKRWFAEEVVEWMSLNRASLRRRL